MQYNKALAETTLKMIPLTSIRTLPEQFVSLSKGIKGACYQCFFGKYMPSYMKHYLIQ